MRFEVDTSSLDYTVKSMEGELEKIIDLSKKLYQSLTALDGMWEGTAHDTFEAQYLSDQQKLTEMQKTISAVIDGMASARKNYEKCEKSVETEIRKIAV